MLHALDLAEEDRVVPGFHLLFRAALESREATLDQRRASRAKMPSNARETVRSTGRETDRQFFLLFPQDIDGKGRSLSQVAVGGGLMAYADEHDGRV